MFVTKNLLPCKNFISRTLIYKLDKILSLRSSSTVCLEWTNELWPKMVIRQFITYDLYRYLNDTNTLDCYITTWYKSYFWWLLSSDNDYDMIIWLEMKNENMQSNILMLSLHDCITQKKLIILIRNSYRTIKISCIP